MVASTSDLVLAKGRSREAELNSPFPTDEEKRALGGRVYINLDSNVSGKYIRISGYANNSCHGIAGGCLCSPIS